MLKITFREENDYKCYSDIEADFISEKYQYTPTIAKLIEKIEKGKYKDEEVFVDRFGNNLYKQFLSTGCKTGILIEMRALRGDTRLIDTIECGWNAINEIVVNCKNGNILIQKPAFEFHSDESNDIDVCLDGYRFTDLQRLNYYLFEEFRHEPDTTIPGIEKMA